MYGQEIARVHAHDNGYTVETKTKPRRKDPSIKSASMNVSEGDNPMPGMDWESSVAMSKKDVMDRVGAAHDAHQESKMRGQYRKLTSKAK